MPIPIARQSDVSEGFADITQASEVRSGSRYPGIMVRLRKPGVAGADT